MDRMRHWVGGPGDGCFACLACLTVRRPAPDAAAAPETPRCALRPRECLGTASTAAPEDEAPLEELAELASWEPERGPGSEVEPRQEGSSELVKFWRKRDPESPVLLGGCVWRQGCRPEPRSFVVEGYRNLSRTAEARPEQLMILDGDVDEKAEGDGYAAREALEEEFLQMQDSEERKRQQELKAQQDAVRDKAKSINEQSLESLCRRRKVDEERRLREQDSMLKWLHDENEQLREQRRADSEEYARKCKQALDEFHRRCRRPARQRQMNEAMAEAAIRKKERQDEDKAFANAGEQAADDAVARNKAAVQARMDQIERNCQTVGADIAGRDARAETELQAITKIQEDVDQAAKEGEGCGDSVWTWLAACLDPFATCGAEADRAAEPAPDVPPPADADIAKAWHPPVPRDDSASEEGQDIPAAKVEVPSDGEGLSMQLTQEPADVDPDLRRTSPISTFEPRRVWVRFEVRVRRTSPLGVIPIAGFRFTDVAP